MDACVVETSYGKVKGERGDGVLIWRGIPYAAPPVGERRFKKPEPPESWEDVRDATRFGPSCPQAGRVRERDQVREMSEDCLTLNIWSPEAGGQKRAVLFYIHGGSFTEGSGCDPEYEGTRLAGEGDVVLVTINYRLGALGFMDFSLLGEEFTANCGIWDIVSALKWVNENIEMFGGDPDNITICGQSAGATCACILSGLDEVRGYFKRAIMMSAVPTLLHTKEQAQKVGSGFLRFIGLQDAASLMAAPVMDLTNRQADFVQQSGLGTTSFAPCVDGGFVKRYPINAALEGQMRGISMLLGTTREEMSFALTKSLAHVVDIRKIRERAVTSESDEVRERVRNAYKRYGKRGPGIMFSDFTFRMPTVWLAESQSSYADTWMYRFDYETLGMRITGLHAFHSCDVPFLFGNFRAGLARYMFMLAPNKRGAMRLHREFRNDFLTFIKSGELPWQRCEGEDGPAKCYRIRSIVEQAVPEEVRDSYNGSEFKRWSFAEEGMDFPLTI